MRVVYIDTLFLLNLVLDYLALLLTGHVAGEPLRRPRLALGAALGALYAVAVFWPPLAFLSAFPLRLAAGGLMVLAAYGTTRRLLRVFLLFCAVSAGLGGFVYALSLLGVELSGASGPVLDLRLILLGAVGFYALLALVGKKLGRHGGGELKRVDIDLGGQTVRLTALVDSGNTLTDPMTGQPVLVAEGDRLHGLLPETVDLQHPAQCLAALPREGRFRLIPYRSVGVEQGLLLAVRADGVAIEGRHTENRLVALSPTPVSDGGGYQALLYQE